MTDFGTIGLNEVELGIAVPKFWARLLGRVTSVGVADKLCCFSQLLTPSQALTAGLVDEVVPAARLMTVRSFSLELCFFFMLTRRSENATHMNGSKSQHSKVVEYCVISLCIQL